MDAELRVIGPPGTGKTTYLCGVAGQEIEEWCQRTGMLPEQCTALCFSSLTRAAAAELKNRGLEIPLEQIGTLHSHAYRALGRPKLCVDGKSVADWNGFCEPSYRMKGDGRDTDGWAGRGGEALRGDYLLGEYHRYRSMLLDPREGGEELAGFAESYESWKRLSDLSDFSDIIHDAYEEVDAAPGDPNLILVDEAQDHDAAELRLIRRWAEKAGRLIIVGDPDQNLYEWRGSNPRDFYDAETEGTEYLVLEQSYRVPVEPWRVAQDIIGQCSDRRPVVYRPKPEPGSVDRLDYSLSYPGAGYILDDAAKHLEAGRSVMFLASCEYMLQPIQSALTQAAIPYWNPYAPGRGGMNPLHPSRGTSPLTRLASFLRPQAEVWGDKARLWKPSELLHWLDACKATSILSHGSKSEIDRMAEQRDGQTLTMERLGRLFLPDQLGFALAGDIDWLIEKLHDKKGSTLRRAISLYRKLGGDAWEDPQVIVGTVHSVKGGEADVVYVSPDLSMAGWDQYDNNRSLYGGRDSILRQFYVAVTRTRDKLVLLTPQTGRSIEWP